MSSRKLNFSLQEFHVDVVVASRINVKHMRFHFVPTEKGHQATLKILFRFLLLGAGVYAREKYIFLYRHSI
jgi:hypothetical protein